MLKNIPPILSPELLKVIAEMGHGDEIVLGDANFPARSHATHHLLRADGHGIPALLSAILPLFPLDYAVEHTTILMQYRGDKEPAVWAQYKELLNAWPEGDKPPLALPKPEFYERARQAYAILATGEREGFANIILRKGVIR